MDRRRFHRMLGGSLAALAGLGLIAEPMPAQAANDGAVVRTDKGPVRGKVGKDHREFLGIPYAAEPVRWGSPQPAKSWSRPRDATRPGNACAQNEGVFKEPYSASEDCLFLNVTTPRHSQGRHLPVMVYIHGSGFRNGAGAMYRPKEMAVRGDVVVVTINYRLGVFGFLDHPALDRGPARRLSGNFGLEDQQAALRWVRRNAAAFGGDAGNVTAFGESAGGVSTCSQLVSPGAAGLFQRAIIQSGPCTLRDWPNSDGRPDTTGAWLPRPRRTAERQGMALARELHCTDIAHAAACLRGKTPQELLKVSAYGDQPWSFAPVFGGGGVLPRDPAKALATGRFAKVPVMHGITRDEYRTFEAAAEMFGMPPLVDPREYAKRVRSFFGKDKAARILARYPARSEGSPAETWSKVITDSVFARSTAEMNRDLARRVPAYAYEFADGKAPWVTGAKQPSFPTGAFHAAELQYQFDTDYFQGERLTPAQRRLSGAMIRYWTRFARTGNPNGPGDSHWPPAGGHTGLAQSLAPGHGGVRPVDFGREHRHGFWKALYGLDR